MSMISVRSADLRDAAGEWREGARVLGELHRTVAGLCLTEDAFLLVDVVSADQAAHHGAYRRFQSAVADALAAGADEFDRVGGALVGSAARCDDTEEAVTSRLAGS